MTPGLCRGPLNLLSASHGVAPSLSAGVSDSGHFLAVAVTFEACVVVACASFKPKSRFFFLFAGKLAVITAARLQGCPPAVPDSWRNTVPIGELLYLRSFGGEASHASFFPRKV